MPIRVVGVLLGLWLSLSSWGSAVAAPVAIHPSVRLDLGRPWSALKKRSPSTFVAERRAPRKGVEASMVVEVEDKEDEQAAIKRLADVESEYPGQGSFVTVGGWPGFERKIQAAYPRPGEAPERTSPAISWRVTTAVAAGKVFIRIETLAEPEMPATVPDDILAAGRKLALPTPPPDVAGTLEKLKSGVLRPKSLRPADRPMQPTPSTPTPTPAPSVPPSPKQPVPPMHPAENLLRPPHVVDIGAAISVAGAGEIEAAVSGDGQSIVTNASCGQSFSTDAGKTFATSAGPSFGTFTNRDGDCSVSWGQSGAFYLSWLGGLVASKGPFAIAVLKSTDKGKNFSLVKVAVSNSSTTGPRVDQPHVAADRFNKAKAGGDRVYMTWHQGASLNSVVACSKDSGKTWGSTKSARGGTGSFPKIALGKDGMVYVVSRSGGNVVIDKFSDCDAGLAEQKDFPVSISIHDVPCPVAGLDRCNDGNTLASPTIAVDDTNAKNVVLAWADSNGGGEDVLAALSTDGGKTFGTSVALSKKVAARRYLPWLTMWNGTVHAGWYDKRDATAAKPDLTRYFRGSSKIASGALQTPAEQDLSGGVDDAECAGGFGSVRSSGDCTACGIPTSSCTLGSGGPKYGDYNGIAAGNGRVVHVWASQTTPGGATAPAGASGVLAWTNVTQVCGASGKPCCPTAPACDQPGLLCGAGSICVPCGKQGQPCCPSGSSCNANLVCTGSNVCSCGLGDQPCCGGTTCNSGFFCEPGPGGSKTCQCGGYEDPCCSGATPCKTSDLVCDASQQLCLAACGHQGQQCCHSAADAKPPTHAGSGPGWCYAGDTCIGDACECGGLNQPCCLHGTKCGGGLSCLNLLCRKPSNGPTCAQCAANLTSCQNGCNLDPAHAAQCKCLCQNTACDCQLQAGCTLSCGLHPCTGP